MAKSNYSYAVFDLDGTLLDTLGDLAASVNYALGELSLPLRSLDEVRQFVGNGVARLIELSVPKGSGEELTAHCLEIFRAHYGEHMLDETKPYDGIIELLTELRKRGVHSCVVSNKFDAAVAELCARFFGDLVDFSVGESPDVRRKPAPDSVLHAMELMNCRKADTLYIGDSEVDGETARAAGIDFVGVSWGFRSKEIIIKSGAFAVVDRAGQLLNYFN